MNPSSSFETLAIAGSWHWLAIAFGLGYLLGSIPFGLLFTRAAGLGDVRQIGSGNIGATNVLRTGRKGIAAATLLFDAAKGAAAVLIADHYFGQGAAILAGLGAFLGHVFPVWLKFKGGKGVATYLGVLLAYCLAGGCGLRCGMACRCRRDPDFLSRGHSRNDCRADRGLRVGLKRICRRCGADERDHSDEASRPISAVSWRGRSRGSVPKLDQPLLFTPAPLPTAELSADERLACLRLIRSENVGPVTFRELINRFRRRRACASGAAGSFTARRLRPGDPTLPQGRRRERA